MAFHASPDRILITDTNGAVAFDTNLDMPHILAIYEQNISKVFYERYYTEDYITIGTLPDRVDFVINRVTCTPYLLEGLPYVASNVVSGGQAGVNAKSTIPVNAKGNLTEIYPWVNYSPMGSSFFQGSTLLEAGCTILNTGGGVVVTNQFARRALHVMPKPEWGNQLVAMFQQGVRSGYGAVDTVDPKNAALFGEHAVRWDISLKTWVGRFR